MSDNELSSYRYAAVVYNTARATETRQVRNLEQGAWIGFAQRDMDGASLREHLWGSASLSSIVAVSNITHRRTSFERAVLELLAEGTKADEEGWLDASDEAASRRRALSADELATVAEDAGFRVELSWARQFSQRGGLDAVFHRIHTAAQGSRVLFRFPTDHEGRPPHLFTNRPLQHRSNMKQKQLLYRDLRTKLPSYMVPTVVKIIDSMPVNENRKYDRRALAMMATTLAPSPAPEDRVEPRNDTEAALCEEFATALGVDVSITDSFFDVGGHSLMATRAVSRINKRLGCSLSVFDSIDPPRLPL